jgi:hypothetical protein
MRIFIAIELYYTIGEKSPNINTEKPPLTANLPPVIENPFNVIVMWIASLRSQ